MADEMVLDTGTEAEIEPIEAPAEGAEPGVEAETSTEAGTAAPATEEDVPAPQIYKAVKEALKAHDPNTLRQVRKALHLMDEVKAKAPDGIGKLVERMELVNQLDDDVEDPEYVPGTRTFDEVIERTMAERTFWRAYDTAFQSGDPSVINQMVEANPNSFQKLLPAAFDKYAELNPDGFSALVCRSVDGFLQKSEIPLQLALLTRVLPQTSTDPSMMTVIEAFEKIKTALGGISAWAKRPVEPKEIAASAAKPGAGAQPAATLEDRELNVKNVEWGSAVAPKTNTFAANEALRVFGEKKFTAPEIEQLKSAVKAEINARTRINDAYQKKIKGFLKANNRTAYNMAVESEHKKIITGSIKRLGDDILGKRAAAPKPKPAAQPKAAAIAPEPGEERFELIAGPPRTQGLQVDFKRNPSGWLEKNQAYIVGRKQPVKWRNK